MIKNYLKLTWVRIVIVVLILAILGLVMGGYYWYMQSKKSGTIQIIEIANEAAFPTISTNPLDNNPNINPADQANPFTNIKTNPF